MVFPNVARQKRGVKGQKRNGGIFIVVGNEKGGAGKSTVFYERATALARMGRQTSVSNSDLRQRTIRSDYRRQSQTFLSKR